MPYHAEIYRPDDRLMRVIIQAHNEEIAGVGVGVEEPIDEHFLDDDARGVEGDPVAVEAGSF